MGEFKCLLRIIWLAPERCLLKHEQFWFLKNLYLESYLRDTMTSTSSPTRSTRNLSSISDSLGLWFHLDNYKCIAPIRKEGHSTLDSYNTLLLPLIWALENYLKTIDSYCILSLHTYTVTVLVWAKYLHNSWLIRNCHSSPLFCT